MLNLNICKGVIAAGLMLGLTSFAVMAADTPVDTTSTTAESSTPPARPAKQKNPNKPYNPPASNDPYAEEKVTDVNDPISTTDD